ncbi:hypothetical protein TWF696_003885 [Orbilia brochopaga]|uniref:Uncharacterized protein n=1 Tax=Orbilia brochopaga TaxID=3140254 RepID=A0AAV9V867_9PEZI
MEKPHAGFELDEGGSDAARKRFAECSAAQYQIDIGSHLGGLASTRVGPQHSRDDKKKRHHKQRKNNDKKHRSKRKQKKTGCVVM